MDERSESEAPVSPTSVERGGLAGLYRRHPRAMLVACSVLAFVLLATGSIAAGALVGGRGAVPSGEVSTSPTASPSVLPTATARPVPGNATAAARLRGCSVADLVADPRLGSFQAQAIDAVTGTVLFDRGGETPSRTASALKVLTASAALSILGPDHRISTTVVKGEEPGSVVLIGGGDLTLSRLPTGSASVYEGAAHLDDLAAQVEEAWADDPDSDGVPISEVVLDASLYSGDTWQSSWNRKEQTDGYMPEITALQVDGDRDDPTATVSTRSTDPIGRAGRAFAAELGSGITVSEGTAPPGAAVLGTVQSQPVSTLVQQTLLVSDNAIAEMLARLTAIAAGAGNSFGAEQAGMLAGLQGYGIDTSGITIVDGSGLSDDNAVAPSYFTRLLVKVDGREGALGAVDDGLPVAGRTGSLSYSDRFTGDNADATGAIRAKPGWIDTGYTLAGIVDAEDGTTLTFAIYALGDVGDDAKQAIDTLATGFFRCGADLSNL